MKQHAHQKIATLCALIGASISCLGVALAEDGSLTGPSAGNVADTASGFAPTRSATAAAPAPAGCALPALAEALAINQYVTVCSDHSIEQLHIASAAHPAVPAVKPPSDDKSTVVTNHTALPAYDEEAMDKLILSLLEDKSAPPPSPPLPPPLSQYDGLRSTNAILLKQETDGREPAQLAQTLSLSLDRMPTIDLQSATTDTQAIANNWERSEPVAVSDNWELLPFAAVAGQAENKLPFAASAASAAAAAEAAANQPETFASDAQAVESPLPGVEAITALEPGPVLPVAQQEMAAEKPAQPQPVSMVEVKQSSSEQGGSKQRPTTDKWVAAVSDTNLDQLRGGFDAGSGLLVSFGIQRAVYINGNLATTTSFNIPDVGKVTGTQAAMLSAAASTVNLVQNGSGNTLQSGALSQAVGATVIQNTLNNQRIQNLTIIDTTTNSLGLLKGINAQSALRDALSNSVGTR